MATTLFLPLLTLSRELDSRLMLAARLAQDGHVSHLGLTRTLTHVARQHSPAIYLAPIFPHGSEARLQEMRDKGHWILGWDEEGLVYPTSQWYADRVGAGAIGCVDTMIYWGPAQRRALLEKTGPLKQPFKVIGNPRADMLRAPYRALIDEQAEAIRARHGRFVLINTNFDLVSRYDGAKRFHMRLRNSGYFAGEDGAKRLARWARFRQRMMDTFLSEMPGFVDALGDVKVILRPHPSEAPEPWLELAERCPRLTIALPNDSVWPWLAAADYVVHNSCTTAIEAFALGTKVIAIDPPDADTMATSRLPNLVSHGAADFAEAAALIKSGGGAPTEQQEAALAKYLAGYPKQDCIEQLGALVQEIAPRLGPAQAPDPAMFESENDIGQVTKLKDPLLRFPPFGDELMAHMRRVLEVSPHGAPRLVKLHDYAVAVLPNGL